MTVCLIGKKSSIFFISGVRIATNIKAKIIGIKASTNGGAKNIKNKIDKIIIPVRKNMRSYRFLDSILFPLCFYVIISHPGVKNK